MFKAVICDDKEEYGFPFITENFIILKKALLSILLMVFIYVLIKPPLATPDMDMVIDGPAMPERVDESGMTRLHRAVINGNIHAVKLLIRNGVSLNRTDKYGWSPLHWPVFWGEMT